MCKRAVGLMPCARRTKCHLSVIRPGLPPLSHATRPKPSSTAALRRGSNSPAYLAGITGIWRSFRRNLRSLEHTGGSKTCWQTPNDDCDRCASRGLGPGVTTAFVSDTVLGLMSSWRTARTGVGAAVNGVTREGLHLSNVSRSSSN